MTQAFKTFSIVLPESADDLGRWLDQNGGEISISCALGSYIVTISWAKLHSYSDARGMHKETWSVSRHNVDLQMALTAALETAMLQSQGSFHQ
jgi:hypothetical protein